MENYLLDEVVEAIPESLLPHLKTLEPFSILVLKWMEDRDPPADTWKKSVRRVLPTAVRERLDKWVTTFRTETVLGKLLEEYRVGDSFVGFMRTNLAQLITGTEVTSDSDSTSPLNRPGGRKDQVSAKEKSHRIKNHLQQVISMIELKRRDSGSSAEEVLDQSIELLRNFVQLNENLESGVASNGTTLDMETHLRTNLESLSSSFAPEALDFHLEIDIDPIDISRDKIVPLGLIVNELCMNSFQHGYDSKGSATLSISLNSESGEAELHFQDDGRGLPDDFDWKKTYGLNLVKRLAEQQLSGSLETTVEKGGTGWVIRFPLVDERSVVDEPGSPAEELEEVLKV